MSWIVGIVPDNFWKDNERRIFNLEDSQGFYQGGDTYIKNYRIAKRFKTHNEAYKICLKKSPHNLMTLEIQEDD